MSDSTASSADPRAAIRSLATFAPVLGMGAAFATVEDALVEAGRSHGLQLSQGLQAMAMLHHLKAMPVKLRDVYLSLHRMLNDAREAERHRVVPEPQVIQQYIDTAFELADLIQERVGNGEPAPTS